MVWSNAKDGFVNLFQNEKFNLETNFKISRIFYLGYKPNLSFEPRVFISDFDGSVIKVDDEEKLMNAVYVMTLRLPFDPAAPIYAVGNRDYTPLHIYHDWPGNNGSIGLMFFLNRS